MKLAYLILAHFQPTHVARLIRALMADDAHFFVHVDAKSDLGAFEAALGDLPRVRLLSPRVEVYWGHVSILEATLALWRAACSAPTAFAHYVNLTDSCYPLKPNRHIFEVFARSDRQHIRIARGMRHPVPASRVEFELAAHHELDDAMLHEGSAELLDIVRGMYWRAIASRARRWPRVYPAAFPEPYKGNPVYSLTHGCVAWILDYLAAHPELLAWHAHTFAPEEIVPHTLVKASPFADAVLHDFEAGTVRDDLHGNHYIDWAKYGRGAALDERDLAALTETPALFARKFVAPHSDGLLARLDALRRQP